MVFNMDVLAGMAWLVHEVPLSVLEKMIPDEAAWAGMASPTRRQCVVEAHVRPLKYDMPPGARL
jgi:hypothetical protein